MAKFNYKPHLITKPIQLIAASMFGVAAINSSLLHYALKINSPSWAAGALVITAICNLPLIIILQPLLLVLFRPYLLEDKHFLEYISHRFSKETENILEVATPTNKSPAPCNDLRAQAQKRMQKDSDLFSTEDLRLIEAIYQKTTPRNNRSVAEDALNQLLEKYENSNRTGCALVYLGQRNDIPDKTKVDYLTKAIEDYSDCFYGDGVQVGAYARYGLAIYFFSTGKLKAAKQLATETKNLFPNAITHNGERLGTWLESIK